MRAVRLAGPIALACALVLGACSTTSGTPQLEQGAMQESAAAADEGATVDEDATVTDPADGLVGDDGESAESQDPAGSDHADSAGTGETFGTRDAPIEPYTEVDFGTGWTVSVGVSDLDAASQIKKIDSYTDEPEAGRVFVSAPLSMSFSGSGAADPGFDLSYAFIGAQGNTFTDRDDCTPFEVALWNVGDMYAGAYAEVLMCISVPEDQADGGVWRIQQFSMDSFERSEAYYSTS